MHAAPAHPTVLRAEGRTIVLVGTMGVGKTTIGRRLAARMQRPFVDADAAIVEAAGMTVPEIFARLGEAAFRDGERRVIARLMAGPPAVLATGGGAFVDPDTRTIILRDGIAVWMHADIATLVDRVKRRDDRPLLKGRDPATVLRELAKVRDPLYALAPIHIRTQSQPHDATVDAIIRALE